MDLPGDNLKIRRAGKKEAALAFEIVREYYRAARVVAQESEAQFRRAYFAPRSGVWLASLGSELAGCIALRRLKPSAAEIKRMYVRPHLRGHGIAQKLLARAERFAQRHGYDWVYLDTTDEMKTAARLYERNGYQACERYNDNPQATIFMRKSLRSKRRLPHS